MSSFSLNLIATVGPDGRAVFKNSLPAALEPALDYFKQLVKDQVVICDKKAYEPLLELFVDTRFIVVDPKLAHSKESTADAMFVMAPPSSLQMARILKVKRAVVVGGPLLLGKYSNQITHFHLNWAPQLASNGTSATGLDFYHLSNALGITFPKAGESKEMAEYVLFPKAHSPKRAQNRNVQGEDRHA